MQLIVATLLVLFGTAVTYVVATAIGLVKAFCLATLWNWFGVPVFGHHLSVVQAYGLSLVFEVLRYRYARLESQEGKTAWQKFEPAVETVLSWLVALGVGWVFHRFFY